MQIRDNQLLSQWSNFTPKKERRECKTQLPASIWFMWVQHLHCWHRPKLFLSLEKCWLRSPARWRRLQQQAGAHGELTWGAPGKTQGWALVTLKHLVDMFYILWFLLIPQTCCSGITTKKLPCKTPNHWHFPVSVPFPMFHLVMLVNSVEMPRVLQIAVGVSKKQAHTYFL